MSLKRSKISVVLALAFGSDGLIGMRDATNPENVTPCTETGVPFVVVVDSGEAAELTAANILGLAEDEQLGVAAEALDYDDRLFPAAGGKLQKLPAATGTYWCCGKASGIAAADGDAVKFIPCTPYPVAVA